MVTLNKSRIEALSDGVFAIAMTLLVLELKVPEVMQHEPDQKLLKELLELAPEFSAYVVTFLIAGRFWYLHHLTFHFMLHVDGFLVAVNLTFLMFVSLLPFSSGLMTHLFVHPVSQLFYFGNQLAIALVLNLHWRYAKDKDFIDTGLEDVDRLTFRLNMLLAVFGACFVTAIFLPAYSWVPFPVFLVGGIVIDRWWRRKPNLPATRR
jgi:uncharacterized membrane protein